MNTFLYAFMLAWFLQLTGISTLGMGLLFLLVAIGRAALPGTEPPGRCAPEGLNPHLINPPRTVRLVDNVRFILMYVVMTGILLFWR